MNFDTAFETVVGHEGGYANHPSDPGGETMFGITKRVAQANGYHGNMKDMPLEFAKAVYKKDYWDKTQCDFLPSTIRIHVFDAAINCGVSRASRWLQECVGAVADGVVGARTISASHQVDAYAIVARFSGKRLAHHANLPTWPTFGRGWARRIASNLENA